MKPAQLLLVLVSLASTGLAQGYPDAQGLLYGHVVDPNGQAAKAIQLQARPLGVALGAVLPLTRTDENGDYRMRVPWWGRYTVYAEDRDAGYSLFTNSLSNPGSPREVTISPDHPQAEFNFQLPPKAGFLHFHLTDAKTGAPISGIEVKLLLDGRPPKPVYGESTAADKPFLVPSNKDVLIHVTSWGYKEWGQSAGGGKAIRLAPGAKLTLNVKLEPDTKRSGSD
jgi:hypothetical protein